MPDTELGAYRLFCHLIEVGVVNGELCVGPLQRQGSQAQRAEALAQEHRGEVGESGCFLRSVPRAFKHVDRRYAASQPVRKHGVKGWFKHTLGLPIWLFCHYRGLGNGPACRPMWIHKRIWSKLGF